jgi:hypothetical protein
MSAFFSPCTVPWSGARAKALNSPRAILCDLVGDHASSLLPHEIHILFGLDMTREAAYCFLQQMAAQLAREFSVWRMRLQALSDQNLMPLEEAEAILDASRSAQPWYVYVTPRGGLYDGAGMKEAVDPDADGATAGAIPCTAAQHHGVAWWRNERGEREAALVTSHREHGVWNWDEDIGHESGHACVGPIPLFSQYFEAYGAQAKLSALWEAGETSPELSARVHYLLAELAVVAMRGEQRSTGTGLPGLEDREDLALLLRMAGRLYPDAGFEDLSCLCDTLDLPIGMWSGRAALPLLASVLRTLPSLSRLTNVTDPPLLCSATPQKALASA